MKICVRCKTENKPDYKYCKMCGAELPCVDRKPIWEEQTAAPEPEISENAEEISTYEMNVFVGKNNHTIVPKFIDLQRNNKKVSFCLPVLLLGLFFGPFGIAAYFLYRKMTKPAIITLGASLVLILAETIANFGAIYQFTGEYLALLKELVRGVVGEAELEAELSSLVFTLSENFTAIFSYINTYLCGVAAPIVVALFTDYLYLEHSLSVISKCKRMGLPRAAYLTKLSSKGGTSGTAVLIGSVVYIAIAVIIIMAPIAAAIIGV